MYGFFFNYKTFSAFFSKLSAKKLFFRHYSLINKGTKGVKRALRVIKDDQWLSPQADNLYLSSVHNNSQTVLARLLSSHRI